MKIGICKKAIANLYENPRELRKKNQIAGVSDEILYGWGCKVLEESEKYYRVETHYGYEGYAEKDSIIIRDTMYIKKRTEQGTLKYVNKNIIDILTIPKVQGRIIATLFRGSLIEATGTGPELKGWVQVMLQDGQSGFTQEVYLKDRPDSDDYLLIEGTKKEKNFLISKVIQIKDSNPAAIACMRENVAASAMNYMSVSYRYAGKTPMGIDCSGLTFMSYLENGILLYRDAKVKEGYPVHEVPLSHIKKGDLLFFHGHVALYLGGGKYIHSTGNSAAAGVTINSFYGNHMDFRRDLFDKLLVAGSIF